MENVYIAPNATVVGDVDLGKHVNIWSHSGDIRIWDL